MKIKFLGFVLTLLSLVTACGAPSAGSSKLRVVATFSVLGDLVQNVGGDQVTVVTLVGPGADTHTFEPSPADSKSLIEAALIFENGLEFESWLDDLYAASGSAARRVVVTQGIEPLTADGHGHEDEAGHEHGQADPHTWHSVANVLRAVATIREALATADPAHRDVYEANASAYAQELQELDTWIFAEVKSLPEDRRKLVTTHDTLAYFAQRYGFEVIGTVLPTTTAGASPSAREAALLVETLKAAKVPAVFAGNVASNALLRQIADEAGVTVVASLYSDALGPPGSEGETYIGMMRYNVTTIVTELSR